MNTSKYLNMVMRDIYNLSSTSSDLPPSTYYIGLATAIPTLSGTTWTTHEVSGNGYSRVSLTASASTLTLASDGVVQNANVITFPTSTGSWGSVTYFLVFDASSNGNLLMYGALSSAKTVGSDTTLSFASGALKFQLSNPA